ncbi:TPA: LysM peptidoglycan-binding domain-containing protein [Escherichia coli]|nr:LysM peptidoglycan-binding domain-containing protein [Escherichia coli]HAY3976957.1 LysM peptidoglycan-binding domain-containing protein [Escherichia coli]HBB9210928.1 LysM peptidoglycan-binding domain-containing protein [Escherichia coli]
MSSYGIFFRDEKDRITIRLPINPEEVNRSTDTENEEYEVLKLGKISVPGSKGLTSIEFEAPLPFSIARYVETPKNFKKPDYYLDKFNLWMKDKRPIRFICTNGKTRDISMLVTIASVKVVEKAGEEGDYLVSYSLQEYVPYQIREVKKTSSTSSTTKSKKSTRQSNPPKPPYNLYTIVRGDCLWNIAKRFLGNATRWPEIYKINKPPLGKNPNLIYPGQKIKIPPK